MQLAHADCDSEHVSCEAFQTTVDPVLGIPLHGDTTVKRGYVELEIGCGVNLETGRSYCSDADGGSGTVRLTRDRTGLYLEAVQNAALDIPSARSYECNKLGNGDPKIRVDGLGPGDDLCVRFGGAFVSHIFPIDEIEPNAKAVGLRYITRSQ